MRTLVTAARGHPPLERAPATCRQGKHGEEGGHARYRHGKCDRESTSSHLAWTTTLALRSCCVACKFRIASLPPLGLCLRFLRTSRGMSHALAAREGEHTGW